jgi:hypothetical protein
LQWSKGFPTNLSSKNYARQSETCVQIGGWLMIKKGFTNSQAIYHHSQPVSLLLLW